MDAAFDHAQALYDAAEPADGPSFGGLAYMAADTHCLSCVREHVDEAAAYIDAGAWVILDADGAAYHVDCAKALGWVPSSLEGQRIARFPDGPWA